MLYAVTESSLISSLPLSPFCLLFSATPYLPHFLWITLCLPGSPPQCGQRENINDGEVEHYLIQTEKNISERKCSELSLSPPIHVPFLPVTIPLWLSCLCFLMSECMGAFLKSDIYSAYCTLLSNKFTQLPRKYKWYDMLAKNWCWAVEHMVWACVESSEALNKCSLPLNLNCFEGLTHLKIAIVLSLSNKLKSYSVFAKIFA